MEVLAMVGNRRLYALVLSCVLAMTALFFVGARAWATATVHRTEARCGRPAAAATAIRQEQAPRSWRAHTLRVAGCGAWRQVHDRMQHRHRNSHRGA
jgi:hypothetical protein